MFDMDSFLQPQIDRIRPLAQSAADEMRAFGHRVIARLDRIADAVEEDERVYWRERPQFNLDVDETEQFTVPAGENWLVEAVTMSPTGAVGTPGGVTLGIGGGLPLYGANHPGRPTTAGGNGIRLESGMTISVTATEVACIVMVQIRVERRMPAVQGRYTPREQPTMGDDSTPNPENWRHVGALSPRYS